MMTGTNLLSAIGEKALPQKCEPGMLKYCPSMDLVAAACIDQQVIVNRLNGQRVYIAAQKVGSPRVEALVWKPNGALEDIVLLSRMHGTDEAIGELLATAWTDGTLRLFGPDSNKVVHKIKVVADSHSSVTCLGWGSFTVGKTGSASSTLSNDARFFGKMAKILPTSVVQEEGPNLPRELALLDVESSLPKLSTLPSGVSSEDIFSSRSSLDALFRSFEHSNNEAIDVLIVGLSNGSVHLSIYDSFTIGSFSLPTLPSQPQTFPFRLRMQATHQRLSSISMLLESDDRAMKGLYFTSMDLRFVCSSNDHLSLLASSSTNLHNLLRYIKQVQMLMVDEWKATQELPSRFLRNINEELANRSQCSIVQAMYHSVATGHTFAVVKEWLVDELAERGHKRWDKAVVTGLENLRRLVHQHFMPALERCSVTLSRLLGIAKYQESGDTLRFASHQIRKALDLVACLNLYCAKIMSYVVEEIDLFAAFSTWLRHEIDRLASNSNSAQSDKSLEKESLIDHAKVLSYIQTAMVSSRLAPFFRDMTADEPNNFGLESVQDTPMFEALAKGLTATEDGEGSKHALPSTEWLYDCLSKQADLLSAQIAEAERKNVLFSRPIALGVDSKDGPIAMRTFYQATSIFNTYIAVSPRKSYLKIFCISNTAENGLRALTSIQVCAVELGNGQISDIVFVDDEYLLVLWISSGGESHILHFPCGINAGGVVYSKYNQSTLAESQPTTLDNSELLSRFKGHKFHSDDKFVPEKLEVSFGAGSNAQDHLRVCVLGKDRLNYRVFRINDNPDTLGQTDGDINMSQ